MEAEEHHFLTVSIWEQNAFCCSIGLGQSSLSGGTTSIRTSSAQLWSWVLPHKSRMVSSTAFLGLCPPWDSKRVAVLCEGPLEPPAGHGFSQMSASRSGISGHRRWVDLFVVNLGGLRAICACDLGPALLQELALSCGYELSNEGCVGPRLARIRTIWSHSLKFSCLWKSIV